MEYYHADRLNYAVAGTPNRLEYDQGFFVKQGDGAADVKPIAHLYKSQVYALAEYLGVPEEIRRRPPTTDTFSLPQTQEEFYFALPYDKMDLCLYAHNHQRAAAEVAPVVGPDRRAGRARLQGHRAEAPHDAVPARPAAARRARRGDHRLMCGIAGVVSLRDDLPPPELDQLARMAGALRHRGPDEFGVYRDRRAGLAHARLSIIDLATGQQPLSNEDGTLWIVFNGEIFNYVELRDELEALRPSFPHPQRHRSDRPRLRAVGRRGLPALQRPVGGRALGRRRDRELVLARDPFGVRPLYVAEHDGRLYFASEVKAIFAGDPDDAAPARSGRARSGLHVLDAGRAADGLRGHRGARAGHDAHLRTRRRFGASRCYDPSFPTDDAAGFRGTLDDAVDRRSRRRSNEATSLRMLRADVPVGSYLSGGLDSSLVAALGLRAKGSKFQTFSLRFEDAEYDETAHQRAMAEHLGSDHHEVLVTRGDIARVFPDVICHTERPVLRTAPAPLFLLSRLVREAGIKVVLTGEGADEMFAGYDLFREAKVRRFWARQPQSDGAAAAARAALSVSRALAGGAARDHAAVLRAGPRARAASRASATSRAGAAPRR